jgi:hypothetical protein
MNGLFNLNVDLSFFVSITTPLLNHIRYFNFVVNPLIMVVSFSLSSHKILVALASPKDASVTIETNSSPTQKAFGISFKDFVLNKHLTNSISLDFMINTTLSQTIVVTKDATYKLAFDKDNVLICRFKSL